VVERDVGVVRRDAGRDLGLRGEGRRRGRESRGEDAALIVPDGEGVTGVVEGDRRTSVAPARVRDVERIMEETQRLLAERLKATPQELESLLRVVRSDLAMSLSVILSQPSPEGTSVKR
jgi:hypothetical protein